MAQVLSPPATSQSPSHHSSTTPPPTSTTPPKVESPEQMPSSASILVPQPRTQRPQQTERIPSYARSRMSQYSARSNSRSRPDSTATTPTPFPSTLSYALVRDFAYPPYNPMHYGPPPSPLSGATTPGSDFSHSGRRMSDPMDAIWGSSSFSTSRNNGWGSASPKPDGENVGEGESLPATSFGLESDYIQDDVVWGPRGKHRKSKSYANMSDYERGRRRDSGGNGQRRTGAGLGNGTSTAPEMFYFAGPQHDPAGVDSLRMSRSGFSSHRRDPHFAGPGGVLSGSRFHLQPSTSNPDAPLETPLDSASSFPLDTIYRYRSSSWEADGRRRRESRDFSSSPPPTFVDPSGEMEGAEVAGGAVGGASITRRVRGDTTAEDEELFSGASIALYDFEPENANELQLREGQEIMVSYRHGQGWLVAENPMTGEQGLVPEEYVRLVRDLDMDMWYQQDADGSIMKDDDDEEEEEEEEEDQDERGNRMAVDGEEAGGTASEHSPDVGLEMKRESISLADGQAKGAGSSPAVARTVESVGSAG